jgi:DNA-binding beta-propeller fold protein YncE
MQVLAPSHTTLYTLYTRQEDHLHARDPIQAGGTGRPREVAHAFVLLLSLNEGWVYCLDLPLPFGAGPAQAHAVAISRDGRRVCVADQSSARVAVADTDSLTVRPRSAAIDVGPNGTVYPASVDAVVAMTGAALASVGAGQGGQRRWPVPGVGCGLRLSEDGRRLYVGLSDRVVILETSTGRQIGRIDVPEMERVLHVGRASPTT